MIEKMQLAPGARAAVQVVPVGLRVKTLEPVPVKVAPEMVNTPVPVFFRVTVCAGLVVPFVTLPKFRGEGRRLTCGVAAMPVPIRPMTCGELAALSVMETEAE